MNSFVYHLKPQSLQGDHLIPLNLLRQKYPDIYQDAFQKYVGRESLAHARLPILNCFWNDVVHLSPFHPAIVRKALEQVAPGLTTERIWFKIPVASLQGLAAIYFEADTTDFNKSYDFPPKWFRPFARETYRELESLPEWTIRYYQSESANGRRPLLFKGAQHILVKAAVPLHRAEEICW